MVTDASAPVALALPLPPYAMDAVHKLARVHLVSPHAVLLAASMHAVREAGHDSDGPVDKGRLVQDAKILLSQGSDAGSGTLPHQRYSCDSGDVLLRVVEIPDHNTFRVELAPLSPGVPAGLRWRLWNRLMAFLEGQPHDVTALARTLATRSPTVVAVEDDDDRFTYGDLARLSGAAACLGTPGSVIGVFGSAGARFWATVFALYDAGLTYVPLDARQPAERLESMVRTADCAAIVDTTDDMPLSGFDSSPIATGLSALAPVISWSRLNDLCPVSITADDPRDVPPSAVAYIMFTSGSTGVPKGVQVTRGALAHLATWAAAELELGVGTVVSQAAAVGFDASAWEVLPAFSAGAQVKVVPDDTRVDPGEFVPWLLSHHVEVAFAPTPIAEMLIGMPWPAQTALRVLGSGGDRLHPIPPGLPFRVLNLYGPTECTIVSAASWVEPGDGMPPIGHVVPHLYHRIVDENGIPVAPGSEGELWLGGAGLALGYAGLPDETAERFIPDPHAALAQRVYRTGDMVRERPDGQLDFLGRRDRQVKISGARVEQGEVEAILRRIPGVRSAVSTVDDRAGVKRLVLHVVPDGTVPTSQITAAAVPSLPPHLRSSRITFTDALPLTINGKVDGSAWLSSGADPGHDR